MKKFTIFSLIIGILFSVSSFAQNVPNGDFEAWEDSGFGYEIPSNWFSISSLTGFQDVTKVSPGQDSDFAAAISPVNIPGIGVSAPILTAMPFGVGQKFGQISLYVEGTAIGGDTLFIIALMQNGTNNIIGIGGGFVTGVHDTFTRFDFPITYEGNESPDSCAVSIMLGRSDGTANEGSEYIIDNVLMSGISAIDDIESLFSAVGNPYPNPANNVVSVPFELKEPSDVTLKVYDMLGRQVYSLVESSYSQGSNKISIDVNGLGAGPYFYTLSSGTNSVATRTFVVR